MVDTVFAACSDQLILEIEVVDSPTKCSPDREIKTSNLLADATGFIHRNTFPPVTILLS